VGITTTAAVLVVIGEAIYVANQSYLPADSAPSIRGTFGEPSAAPLRLALLGDSTAAGVGVSALTDTVAGRLALSLAGTGRRVSLDGLAVSGSRAKDLAPQVSRALLTPPDVAVILIGANDATHLTSPDSVEDAVRVAVRRLRDAHVSVVVGTCPDMGATPAFPQPLRAIAGWRGKQVAAATRRGAEAAGGSVVDIAAATGAAFRADHDNFGTDNFHPSAKGYRLWSDALLAEVERAAHAARTS
jgi:lysophospholipase L1-like esterase